MIAANESEFWPSVFSNPEFTDWSIRAINRFRMAAGSSDRVMQLAFSCEGVPPQEWIDGFEFAISLRLLKTAKPTLFAVG